MSVSANFENIFHPNCILESALSNTHTAHGNLSVPADIKWAFGPMSPMPCQCPSHPFPMDPGVHPTRHTHPYSEAGSFLLWHLVTLSRTWQASPFFLQKSNFEFIAAGKFPVSLHLRCWNPTKSGFAESSQRHMGQVLLKTLKLFPWVFKTYLSPWLSVALLHSRRRFRGCFRMFLISFLGSEASGDPLLWRWCSSQRVSINTLHNIQNVLQEKKNRKQSSCSMMLELCPNKQHTQLNKSAG